MPTMMENRCKVVLYTTCYEYELKNYQSMFIVLSIDIIWMNIICLYIYFLDEIIVRTSMRVNFVGNKQLIIVVNNMLIMLIKPDHKH